MEWDELPERARTRAVALAADALSDAGVGQVPPALAAVARFAPAQRARRGATVLARQLQRDPAFRALVAHHAGRHRAGGPNGGSDDATAVAVAYLAGTAEPDDAVARLTESSQLQRAERRITELEREIARLTAAAEQDRRRAAELSDAASSAEADKLRRRLREQGSRVRAAERAAEQAIAAAADSERTLRAELTAAENARADAEERARRAADSAERTARALAAHRESEQRSAAAEDRRVDLLLSTISAAAAGLRREWTLATQGELPADVVARRIAATVPASALRVPDGGRLLEVLSLPGAHLIVDGYNVSKSGFPELPLTEQRDRLIRSLSGLAARTSAEVTVVFDGAAVSTPPPPGRKIRVLFSPPDVIADDVIRRLVDAEPGGRVLVVATSDRAVVADVARSGARTAAADVLLAALPA